MGPGLRRSIVVGVSAFALSVLIGLVFRVGLPWLLARAVAFGVAFGVAQAALQAVIVRFLPELMSDTRIDAATAEGDQPRIDIVLPGDEAVEGSSEPMIRAAASERPADAELDREAEALGSETLIPDDGGERPVAPGPARPPAAFEDLDVLPDLDGFAGTFEGSQGAEQDGERSFPAAPSRADRGNAEDQSGGGGEDPVELASAIRTLLKRDQKG